MPVVNNCLVQIRFLNFYKHRVLKLGFFNNNFQTAKLGTGQRPESNEDCFVG